MNAKHPRITILTSGVGLGLYIPAVLIERRLRRAGFDVDVEVLEGYYTPPYQRAHLAHRDAHHANFALAQLAHRMARDVEHCLERDRIRALFECWQRDRRRHFVVWAGFWLPVLEEYRRMIHAEKLDVDRCRIDAVVSASFKVHRDLDVGGEAVWLWSAKERRIVHEIPVTDARPIPFETRDERLVVHGGGWGIGTYRATLPDLARTAYGLDVVIHDMAEAVSPRNGDQTLMLDPAWRPWQKEPGEPPAFPPMTEVVDRSAIGVRHGAGHHALHDVIRAAKAIVSKPGGCTLIDSLAAATPVVFLEPYGYAEASNASLWEHLGFGISYAAWKATGYDPVVLERLHANIVARARGVDYPRAYAQRLAEN